MPGRKGWVTCIDASRGAGPERVVGLASGVASSALLWGTIHGSLPGSSTKRKAGSRQAEGAGSRGSPADMESCGQV